ncbi:MAG: DNA translocase FtsK 4TM domain-containing protein [Candidatus Pacebacteria bacterium]|nr:DNA translocase FtsK 4TM domain-containing protein [Candidatus Paceibacterota bacterium]
MTKKRRKKRRSYNNLLFGFPRIEIDDWIKKDVIAIFLFVLALLSILSFVDLAGGFGEKLSGIIKILFGWGIVLFPFALILWGWKMLRSESIFESRTSVFGIVILVFSMLSFMHIFYDPAAMFEFAKSGTGGGVLGAILAWILVSLVGKWGGLIIVLALFLISLLLIFDISFMDLLGKIKFSRKNSKLDLDKKSEKEDEAEDAEDEMDGEHEDDDIKINIVGKNKEKKEGIFSSLTSKVKRNKKEPKFSVKAIEDGNDANEKSNDENNEADNERIEEDFADSINKSKQKEKNWKIPPLGLLDGKDSEPTSGDIKANSNIIKRTLANFGIEIEMGEVNVGPTVTQYTLKPAVGIKLSRITALQNDLALALAARSLRIEAPIPGRSWIGLELPNQSVAMVGLKNILSSTEFYNRKSNLSVVLGRDVAGNAILADLGKMPHLMIAGSTGSGKTVCVNTLISGLLFQNSPETLKFILVDPKRVELTPYNDIPHLLTGVITDPDKAVNSLKWSISEMENRYETLSHLGCRNIESYNHAVRTKYKQREILPYIVIVIDELADLMATHGREVEAAIVRLAQMARAVGIHLVLSTQRPSVEVITGLIKANITTRIAFQVASQIDSRTILDMSGAEKLLGSGDMLYLSGDSNKPKRIQGVFISEEEIQAIVGFLKDQKKEETEYNEEITETKKSSLDLSSDDNIIDDDLYDEAVETVMNAEKASASLLQRRLRVGYARAARLLDLMEEQGVVGPANGAKPREVYGIGDDEEAEDDENEDNEE